MSFILEGLKKSEKKREETAVPNLHTVHVAPRAVKTKRPLWPYLLVAALVLNAGVLLWFLLPAKEQPPKEAISSPAAVSTENRLAAESPAAQTPVPEPADEPVSSAGAVVVAEPSPVAIEPAQPASAPVPLEPVVAPPAEPALIVEAPAATEPAEVPSEPQATSYEPAWQQERRIHAIDELPHDVQGRLPEIQVSVYAYSNDPASRLVRVNNRILREGSYLDVGLLLDEITPNGLIFTFEGYRFWVPKQ